MDKIKNEKFNYGRHGPLQPKSAIPHLKNVVYVVFTMFEPSSSIMITLCHCYRDANTVLSSPRAKRTGPKGLHAESARAVTGRQNSHSGRGEDFLTGQPDFFYGNSCNSGTESRKIVSKVGN